MSNSSEAGTIKVWAAVAGSYGRVRITEVAKLYEASGDQTDDDDFFGTDDVESEPSSLTFLWVLVRKRSASLDPSPSVHTTQSPHHPTAVGHTYNWGVRCAQQIAGEDPP